MISCARILCVTFEIETAMFREDGVEKRLTGGN